MIFIFDDDFLLRLLGFWLLMCALWSCGLLHDDMTEGNPTEYALKYGKWDWLPRQARYISNTGYRWEPDVSISWRRNNFPSIRVKKKVLEKMDKEYDADDDYAADCCRCFCCWWWWWWQYWCEEEDSRIRAECFLYQRLWFKNPTGKTSSYNNDRKSIPNE